MKDVLEKHLKNYSKLKEKDIGYIIDTLLNSEICKPTERELRSFFYGNAYIKQFYGECKNFKKTGIEMYNTFLKRNYNFSVIFADSSELCWNIAKTLEIIKKDKEDLFGSGLLIHQLTNNFSDNDSNIFIKSKETMLFLNNVWN